MDRASFLRKSLMGLSVGVVAPSLIAACSNKTETTSTATEPEAASAATLEGDPKAGGVYYTAATPGRWPDAKVEGHLPKIEVEKMDDQKTKVKVVNTHPMKGYEHYIIKHQLLNGEFDYVDEKLFDPNAAQEPVSEFILTDYSGPLYALSYCNVHDVWVNQTEV